MFYLTTTFLNTFSKTKLRVIGLWLFLFAFVNLNGQTSLLQYTFENNSTAPILNIVSGTFSDIGTNNHGFFTGLNMDCNGTVSEELAYSRNGWNTGDAYRFSLNAMGWGNLRFSCCLRTSSTTTAGNFRIRASSDGGVNWTDGASFTFTTLIRSASFDLPSIFNDASSVWIEVYKEDEAVGSTTSSPAIRIDNVVITGLSTCPSLTTAPSNVTIINSTCSINCTRSGGVILAPGVNVFGINAVAPPSTPCPAGSTLQYNVNGTGWTSTLPTYAQNGPAQTIITRCNCNTNNNISSPTSSPVTTVPGACTGECGLIHISGSVGGCTSSANISSTNVSITANNCYYPNSFTSDQVAFAQTTICGDGSITAQVTSITPLGLGWAGVTMRENNDAGAKKAQLMTNLSAFSRREFRTTTGGAAYPQQFPSQNRYWLRITRTGNQFDMYVSPNGTNWFFAGSQVIVMNNCIEAGLVVTNYNPNSTVTADFANINVTGSGPAPVKPSYNPQNDVLAAADFKISPNPTYGNTEIDLSAYTKNNVQIDIISLQGKLLRSTQVEADRNREEIDLTGFTNGMYLIRLRAEGLPDVTKRLVIGRTP